MHRPAHLTPHNASAFGAESVADAYRSRLPYSDEVFDVLEGLIVDEPRVVLDLGAGTGDIARRMAPRVERVDAVDTSAAMISRGKCLPGGDASNLNWIQDRAEDAPLTPPYALVTAGESLHWMDWDVLLPRLAACLMPGGCLAMIDRNELAPPWQEQLMEVIRAFTASLNYEPYDLVELLESRGLFEPLGRVTATAQRTRQSADGYLLSFHSRASLTPQRLGAGGVADFDARVRETVGPWARDGMVTLEWAPTIVWGRPLAGPGRG